MKIPRSSTCSRCCSNDLCNTDCWKTNLSGTTTTSTAKSTITLDTTVMATITTATTTLATTTSEGNPKECSDIHFDKHGVFTIYPKGDIKPKSVYCMILDGVKWTVNQWRFNGSIDFNRTWNEYREGFGNVNTEYWLGNKHIHSLTTNEQHKLHIHLQGKDGTVKYADYLSFHVSNEGSKYLLNVTSYSGIAGDCLNNRENKTAFSTKDQENMENEHHGINCAKSYSSGWWYKACYDCNLNEYGRYGPLWRYNIRERFLKATIMMISKV
ncbi:Fibrinogen-like protein 1,Fibrinogen-like protein A,Ficolin-2,Ficolin-1,Fibroleukin,Fibrinogen C domain-containing protein 1 [Mytilus coruscus]|uniref:Fibrinogen-like protein 1,Fibrinogen-like protein A,Ficolin-2,Ficolin-1,Fibroleukin,Fibrinogen C domain-containing protein 1 n=1 Tax=Mytilus coruscus TaxID=42192 RepID=A0A6J8DLS3_MYTCO|nr:Fibrinogen-like protein 1,Fibrinogen-like protein A,Ficolin-2,Ficolin-1,Fibroleukin,Fibrinogen C domain-containing protein 1 [Mytilus coruscus]